MFLSCFCVVAIRILGKGKGKDYGKGNGTPPLPPSRGDCCFCRCSSSSPAIGFFEMASIGRGIKKSKNGRGPGTHVGGGVRAGPEGSWAAAGGPGPASWVGGAGWGWVDGMGCTLPSRLASPLDMPPAGAAPPSKSRFLVMSDLESGGRSTQTRVVADARAVDLPLCLHNASI